MPRRDSFIVIYPNKKNGSRKLSLFFFKNSTIPKRKTTRADDPRHTHDTHDEVKSVYISKFVFGTIKLIQNKKIQLKISFQETTELKY